MRERSDCTFPHPPAVLVNSEGGPTAGLSLYPTRAAEEAIGESSGFSVRRGESEVGPDSLLLALLARDTGVGARLLARMGIAAFGIFELLECRHEEQRPPCSRYHLPLSPDARQILTLAQREAHRRGGTAFGVDHLLLTLSRSATAAGTALCKAGATPGRLQAEVNRLDAMEERSPGRGRPHADSGVAILPLPVGIAAVLLYLQLSAGTLVSAYLALFPTPQSGGGAWQAGCIAAGGWNGLLALVLVVQLLAAREWGWCGTVLWFAEKAAFTLGVAGSGVFTPNFAERTTNMGLGLGVGSLLALTAVALFHRRDWFAARPGQPWKGLLRQGGVLLAVTAAVDLLPIILPAIQQLSAVLRGHY